METRVCTYLLNNREVADNTLHLMRQHSLPLQGEGVRGGGVKVVRGEGVCSCSSHLSHKLLDDLEDEGPNCCQLLCLITCCFGQAVVLLQNEQHLPHPNQITKVQSSCAQWTTAELRAQLSIEECLDMGIGPNPQAAIKQQLLYHLLEQLGSIWSTREVAGGGG